MLLARRGHQVSGFSLDPTTESLFVRAGVGQFLTHDIRGDIRNFDNIVSAARKVSPDFLIHFAAQALVRGGYRSRLSTYETNVLGTWNVLNAVEQVETVQGQIVATTDKVYRPKSGNVFHLETDALGGTDPYSASKSMADIFAQEWFSASQTKVPGAIARAGNVIGAGDSSTERLIPDILRSSQNDELLLLRYPHAVRPWQHVLDCLEGYLILLDNVARKRIGGAWNFGPPSSDQYSVLDVVEESEKVLGKSLKKKLVDSDGLEENPMLLLDSGRARKVLGWIDKVPFRLALEWSLIESRPLRQGELLEQIEGQIAIFEATNRAISPLSDLPASEN